MLLRSAPLQGRTVPQARGDAAPIPCFTNVKP